MKKAILGLFIAGIMMSFTNLNAKEISSDEDFGCTVTGAGVEVTASDCEVAYELWVFLVS